MDAMIKLLCGVCTLAAYSKAINHSWSYASQGMGSPNFPPFWPNHRNETGDSQRDMRNYESDHVSSGYVDDSGATFNNHYDSNQMETPDQSSNFDEIDNVQQQRFHSTWTEPYQPYEPTDQYFARDYYTDELPNRNYRSTGVTSRLKSFVSNVKGKVQDAVINNPGTNYEFPENFEYPSSYYDYNGQTDSDFMYNDNSLTDNAPTQWSNQQKNLHDESRYPISSNTDLKRYEHVSQENFQGFESIAAYPPPVSEKAIDYHKNVQDVEFGIKYEAPSATSTSSYHRTQESWYSGNENVHENENHMPSTNQNLHSEYSIDKNTDYTSLQDTVSTSLSNIDSSHESVKTDDNILDVLTDNLPDSIVNPISEGNEIQNAEIAPDTISHISTATSYVPTSHDSKLMLETAWVKPPRKNSDTVENRNISAVEVQNFSKVNKSDFNLDHQLPKDTKNIEIILNDSPTENQNKNDIDEEEAYYSQLMAEFDSFGTEVDDVMSKIKTFTSTAEVFQNSKKSETVELESDKDFFLAEVIEISDRSSNYKNDNTIPDKFENLKKSDILSDSVAFESFTNTSASEIIEKLEVIENYLHESIDSVEDEACKRLKINEEMEKNQNMKIHLENNINLPSGDSSSAGNLEGRNLVWSDKEEPLEPIELPPSEAQNDLWDDDDLQEQLNLYWKQVKATPNAPAQQSRQISVYNDRRYRKLGENRDWHQRGTLIGSEEELNIGSDQSQQQQQQQPINIYGDVHIYAAGAEPKNRRNWEGRNDSGYNDRNYQ